MEQLTHFWQRIRSALMITLGLLPVPLLVTAYAAPDLLPLVWVWPLCHLLLDVAGTYVKGKLRIGYVILQLAVVIGIAVAMFLSARDQRLFILAILYAALLLMAFPRNSQERTDQSYLFRFTIAGVVAHLSGQFFVNFDKQYDTPILTAIAPWLTVGFVLFAFLGMILLNGSNLALMSRRRMQVSQNIRRKNQLMTLIIAAVACAVALIPGLVSGIKVLLGWLITAIRYVVEWLKRKSTGEGGGSGESAPTTDISGIFTEETRVTPPWVETLVTVTVLLVVGALAVYLLYFLGKKLLKLIRRMNRGLQKYLHAASEDYIDEITDTRDDHPAAKVGKEKKLSAANIRKLEPAQRIRYRYRLLMGQHPQWVRGSTARENLGRDTAAIYESVRYGGGEATEADAQRFDEATKKI